jgi:uncharacterized repeat protein (TIGR01451 family)
MSTSILIVITLALACMFAIQTRRTQVISSRFLKRENLTILLGCMVLLTIFFATRISPLSSLVLSAFICGILWRVGRVEVKLRTISPQQQKALITFLVGCMGSVLIAYLPGVPLPLRLGLGGLLIAFALSIVMTHFIRLRAWVLASLIAFGGFSAFFVEGLMSQPSQAYTISSGVETIKAGAYIIDMGVPTQTIGNGLKPHGLVYELITKKGIPVKWAIEPNKIREGTDFSYGGKAYKGGSFIVEKGFAAEAAATIATWKAQGVVVDGPTTTDFTAPIFTTLHNLPNAVLDLKNGAIAQAYYTNAGIPASTSGTYGTFTTYRFADPSGLTSCDDIFVMPHADPAWATHQNLISFTQSQGFIWAACHAVSVLENIDDPTDGDALPDMNFLSHVPPAVQDSPSLKLFGQHAAPTVGPYQYANNSKSVTPYGYNTTNIWSYPIMQFLGKIDLATQNGSEQVYIPNVGNAQWRDETTIAVYDDNNTDAVAIPKKGIVPPTSQIKAVKMAYGPGFGSSNNGIVMYEAGHSHAKATLPDNIAAQRAFFNWTLLGGVVRGLDTDVLINGVSANAVDKDTATPPSIPAGATVPVQANVSGGSGGYRYQWYSSCGGSFASPIAKSTTFTAPASTGSCTIRAVITDSCNRRSYAAFPDVLISGPQADLGIQKTDNQTIAKTGSPISYTITVTNNGPTTVQSLTVTDNIPATILNPVFTPSTGSFSYNSSTGVGTWTGLTLAQGQSIALTLKGTVDQNAAANSTLTNTATVAPGGGLTDPVSGNNSSTDTDTLQAPSASLTVTKENGGDAPNFYVTKDGVVTYTITVTNNGPDPVKNIQIEDQIIAKDKAGKDVLDTLTLQTNRGTLSSSPTAFANNTTTVFTSNFSPLTWQNVNLAVGESVTLTISGSLKVDQTKTPLQNTVRLTPLGVTGSYAEATDTDTIVANSALTEIDLNINKTSATNSSPPYAGQQITYTIVVTNQKKDTTAASAVITDTIPTVIKNATWTCTKTPAAGTDVSTACGSASGGVDINNALNTTTTIKNVGGTTGKVTYTVTGTIDPTATGTLNNTAIVTPGPTNFDKDATDNTSTHLFTLARQAKVVVTKTDSQTFAAPGAPITYSITVKNEGPSVINSVKVTDIIPKNILNPVFAVNTGTFSPTKTTGSTTDTWLGDWTNLNLIPGSTSTDTITLTVSGTLDANASAGTNNLTNTVTIDKPSSFTGTGYGTAYTVDTANSTLTATDIDSIKPIADLSVTKTDNQATAIPGEPTSYIITITNNGPSTVNSLTLDDSVTVPTDLLNPLLEPSTGTYDLNTKLWSGLTLQPTQSVTLVLSGMIDPTATGILTNTVKVAPAGGVDDPTPNDSNDSDIDKTTLTPQADLSIYKTDGKKYTNPGDSITYELRISNLGPSTVKRVVISDPLPPALTLPTFTASTGIYDSMTGNWTDLNLKSGETITLSIQGTVASSFVSGTLTNTATVSLPIGITDPNAANNSSTDTTTVPTATGNIDLKIEKTNNNTGTLIPGSEVNYEITVSNNSPLGSPSVDSLVIMDIIPPDLQDAFFASASGTYNSSTGEFNLNQPLLPGSSVTLLVSGTLSTSPTSTTLKNTATAAPPAGFTDTDSSNNTATDEDPIQGTTTNHANVLLVKRITQINESTINDGKDLAAYTNIDDYPYDDNVLDSPMPTPADTDKWPEPLADSLRGAVSAGRVSPADEMEYTIYYLSAGNSTARNVQICDRIPSYQTFVANTYNNVASAPGGLTGTDRGISVLQNGTNYSYTNVGGDDTAEFYPPGSTLPAICNGTSAQTQDNGAIVVNLGDLPNATAPGPTLGSYGFVRFRVKGK